jgi:molybdenum cofactor cytidylyltransferase
VSGVAALVLAAGCGSRFGTEPKLLALLDGKPLVRHVAEAALASQAAPVLVVVGKRAPEIIAALAGLHLSFIQNPDFAGGLSTSLRAGFAALPPTAAGAVVLLGDMPRVQRPLIDGLIAAWDGAGRPHAAVPVAGGRRGNPVLLAAALAPEIARLSGDVGAGPLLRAYPDVLEWPTDDPGVLADVDTPAELAGLRKAGER